MTRLAAALVAAFFILSCNSLDLYPRAHGGIDCNAKPDGSIDPRCAPEVQPQSPPEEEHGDEILLPHVPFVDLAVLRFVSASDAYPRPSASDVSCELPDGEARRNGTVHIPSAASMSGRNAMVRGFHCDRAKRSQGSRWGDPVGGLDFGRAILREWLGPVARDRRLPEVGRRGRELFECDRADRSKPIDRTARRPSRRI
jgi:hypothetical protein